VRYRARANILKRLLPLFIIFSCFSQLSYSQHFILSDSARISLITNAPSDRAIYTLFGHTALRVKDVPNGIDVIFNYGIFDFQSDNFIYRFMKGETDYMVVASDFQRYNMDYHFGGVDTYEQALNLTKNEKQAVWDFLMVNILPENRVYRYNYFFDNCSTRPRDIIEKNIEGEIIYKPTNKNQTFRDLVHEYTNPYPWIRFGIDLVIGSEADRKASDYEKMFLPLYLMDAYEGAIVKTSGGQERKLVSEEYVLYLNEDKTDILSPVDYPLICGCILFIITVAILWLTFRKKSLAAGKFFDVALFFVAGIAGCIIAFMVFVSEHPCTGSNWNLVWLNPLQLVFAFLFLVKRCAKCVYYYHFINFALLSLFLVCLALIPQQLETAFIPYILSIWLRSGTNFVQYKQGAYKK